MNQRIPYDPATLKLRYDLLDYTDAFGKMAFGHLGMDNMFNMFGLPAISHKEYLRQFDYSEPIPGTNETIERYRPKKRVWSGHSQNII